MDFIFELISEIIIEPIVEGYILAMMNFSNGSKKVDEDKIKTFVVFECVGLFLLFIVGGIMTLESDGASLIGKVLFYSSVAVSLLQIAIGIVLKIRSKGKK